MTDHSMDRDDAARARSSMADRSMDRDDDAVRRRLKRTAVKVSVVQVITLLLLGLFQAMFSSA